MTNPNALDSKFHFGLPDGGEVECSIVKHGRDWEFTLKVRTPVDKLSTNHMTSNLTVLQGVVAGPHMHTIREGLNSGMRFLPMLKAQVGPAGEKLAEAVSWFVGVVK